MTHSVPASARKAGIVGHSGNQSRAAHAESFVSQNTIWNAWDPTGDYIVYCNFNDNTRPFCDWRQTCEHDEGEWIRAKGSTPTQGTGPDGDYPDRYGYYLYQEATNLIPGDTTRLVSPILSIYGDICIDFWYHMYGSENENQLKVLVKDDTGTHDVWQRKGQQGSDWLYGSVTVSLSEENSIQVIFEGIRGLTEYGDVALDNIGVKNGACEIKTTEAPNLTTLKPASSSSLKPTSPPDISDLLFIAHVKAHSQQQNTCGTTTFPSLSRAGICFPANKVDPVCTEEEIKVIQSQDSCGKILPFDGVFQHCHTTVDPREYFLNCFSDMCELRLDPDILCLHLQAYTDSCHAAGAVVLPWRNSTFCALDCPPNSHYEQCGMACPATCVNPGSPSNCNLPCTEGCVCDPGYVLYDQKCVPSGQCGCWDNDKHYPVGSEFWTDDTCSTKCTCPSAGGSLMCNPASCQPGKYCGITNGVPGCFDLTFGNCITWGDPHYHTFDKEVHDFMGICTYTLSKLCTNTTSLPYFNIEAKNEHRYGNQAVSLIQKVMVEVYDHKITIVKDESSQVLVDGIWTNLPVIFSNGSLTVKQSGRYVIVETDFHLTVSYDIDHTVDVKIATTYFNKTCGMCGNFNGIRQDDFMMPNGQLALNSNQLGDSWKVEYDDPLCDTITPTPPPPCPPETEELYSNNQFCGLLTSKDGPFKACHSVINPDRFFDSCVFDLCALGAGSLCKALEGYADACQRAGATIAWRNSTFCPLPCPVNSHYNPCSSACPATCVDQSAPSNCNKPCTDACECDNGFVLSGHICVPVSECGCFYEDRYYMKNEIFWKGDCQGRCTCQGNNHVTCTAQTCAPDEVCKVQNGIRNCFPADTSICHIYGDPHYITFDGKSYHFQGACNYTAVETCGNTSVYFSITTRNEHRGSPTWTTINSVAVSFIDLNIILGRKKVVEVNGLIVTLPVTPAAGISVSLSGSFVSLQTDFGLEVKFNGDQELFVKVNENLKGKLCGLCGTYNGNQRDDFLTPEGLFAPTSNDFGNSWRVPDDNWICEDDIVDPPPCDPTDEIKYEDQLNENLKGKLCGLCGTYNGNPKDDFLTPEGLLAAISNDFGNSWRVPDDNWICEDDIVDPPPCDPTDEIKYEDQCKLILVGNGPFKECHPHIPPQIYFESCVYDLCATGGNQDQYCNALEAYAAACENAGISVGDWSENTVCRTPSTTSTTTTTRPTTQALLLPGSCEVSGDPHYYTFDNQVHHFMGTAVLKTNFGLEVKFNGNHELFVKVNENLKGKLCGLCGTYNGNPKDDFLTPEGLLAATSNDFGNSWRVPDDNWICEDDIVDPPPCDPTDEIKYEDQCKLILLGNGPFKECHPHIPPQIYFDSCVYDLCATGGNQDQYCNALEAYAAACENAGISVGDWSENTVCGTPSTTSTTTTTRPTTQALLLPGSCEVSGDPHYYTFDNQVHHFMGTNGIRQDDFMMPNGQLALNSNQLGDSWKVEYDDPLCDTITPTPPPPCPPETEELYSNNQFCGLLTSKDGPFKACHSVINPDRFFDSCVFDLCALGAGSLCKVLEGYADACQRAGATIAWRNSTFCPLPCPANSHYNPCSSACPATCVDQSDPSNCNKPCTETCECDNGFVLSGHNCVPVSECGCFYDGKYYEKNEIFWKGDCEGRCTCQGNNHVTCTAQTCAPDEVCKVQNGIRKCFPADTSICHIYGDPHYITFDGKSYHFQGACNYTAVETCGNTSVFFSITTRNEHRGSPTWTAINSVAVSFIDLNIILGRNKVVEINGLIVTLPVTPAAGISVSLSGSFVALQTDFGLEVNFNGDQELFVKVNENLKGKLCGLCGTYNGNQRDDFLTPEGLFAPTSNDFGNSWRVPDDNWICEDDIVDPPPCDPTDEIKYEDQCKLILVGNGPFKECHPHIPPQIYFESCVYDLCATGGNQDQYCNALEAYAAACENAGISVSDWRENTVCQKCRFECSFDVDLCNWKQSATDPIDWTRWTGSTPSIFTGPSYDHTTGGGYYLYIDGRYSNEGDFARLESPANCLIGPHCLRFWYHMYGVAQYMELKVALLTVDGLVYASYLEGNHGDVWRMEEVYLPDCNIIQVFIEGVRGEDYRSDIAVDDISLVPGYCKVPSPTTTIATMTSRTTSTLPLETSLTTSKTSTTKPPTPSLPPSGSCEVSGDPHYYTFDNQVHHFMGTCTYTLSKLCEVDGHLAEFNVEAANEHRGGNTKVSYISYVNIDIYGYRITLEKNRNVKVDNVAVILPVIPHPNINIFLSGHDVMVTTAVGMSDLFYSLFPVYTALNCPKNSHYESCGTACPSTCVNPSAPLKCHLPCTESCICNPGYVLYDKRCVPSQQCGCWDNDKHYPVGSEHSVINPDRFFDSCVFDLCALGAGSLCKALEGYADACQRAGATIAWRNSTFCPLPCPANSHYNPCSSACPATCVDQSAPSNCNKPCTETCECDNGFVLSGNNCVPVSECGCFYEDRYHMKNEIFWKGDCQGRCTCQGNNHVTCTAQTCAPDELCKVQNGIRNCFPADTSICHIYGDPHYITFDGKSYHFQGACNYTAVETCGNTSVYFSITTRNEHRGSPTWTTINSVAVSFIDLNIILGRNKVVEINGLVASLPVTPAPGISISISGGFAVLKTNFGLEVKFNDFTSTAASTTYTTSSSTSIKTYPMTYISSVSPTNTSPPSPSSTTTVLAPPSSTSKIPPIPFSTTTSPPSHYSTALSSSSSTITNSLSVTSATITSTIPSTHSIGSPMLSTTLSSQNSSSTASGICSASGDPHYNTFDGRVHHYMGNCSYTLTKLCDLSSSGFPYFHVYTTNEYRGSNTKVSYVQSVHVEVYNTNFTMLKNKKLNVNGKRSNLPTTSDSRFGVHLSGNYMILATDFGLQVRFDGNHYVDVYLPSIFKNHLCGLCGNYNGISSDDLLKPDGTLAADSNELGESWIVLQDGKLCGSENLAVCNSNDQQDYSKTTVCGIITDPSGIFKDCHSLVNPNNFFENCVLDMCYTQGESTSLCYAVQAYAQQCSDAGVCVEWRSDTFCPLSCPARSYYKSCGTTCPSTCFNSPAVAPCKSESVEGCFCNEGYTLSGDKCVHQSECGCIDKQNNSYQLGESWLSYENCTRRCTCNNNNNITCETWQCGEREQCKVVDGVLGCHSSGIAACHISGDPHFYTFDKVMHTFMGTCTYVLVDVCDKRSIIPFTITGKTEDRGQRAATYLKEAYIDVYGIRITLQRDRRTLVGDTLIHTPWSGHLEGVSIANVGLYIVVTTDFGMIVKFDGNHHLEIVLPESYFGKVCGMCGNFNGNKNDEYLMPNSLQASNVIEFGNSWKTTDSDDKCLDDDRVDLGPPCTAAQRPSIESQCNALLSDTFKPCHQLVDPQLFIQSCVYDMCRYNGMISTLCAIFQAYTDACRTHGVKIKWRNPIFCPLACPVHSKYTDCASLCPSTCNNIYAPDICDKPTACLEGCVCDDGYVLSGDQCVPLKSCGCRDSNDNYYNVDESWITPLCTQKCECKMGNEIKCKSFSCPYGICSVNEMGKYICKPTGFSKCTVGGDPHYLTFDGLKHHFQGKSTYILTQTSSFLPDYMEPFTIEGKNEAMFSFSKFSLLKELHIKIYNHVISFRQNKILVLNGVRTVPPVRLHDGIHIFQKPTQIYLETDFGLSISFDGNENAEITVPNSYKDLLEGLCGNFDGRTLNDFNSPDGRLISDVASFGESWNVRSLKSATRVRRSPLMPLEEEDIILNTGDNFACSASGMIFVNSSSFCGVMRDPLGPFRYCNPSVPPEEFIVDCIFDTCAEFQSKEMLCINLARYALACQQNGIAVEGWRESSGCALTCSANSVYKDCMSACPASCSNMASESECGEPCIEGCQCEPGYILSGYDCVPYKDCGCTYLNKYYKIGENFIIDDCSQNCTCTDSSSVVCELMQCKEWEECTTASQIRGCFISSPCLENPCENGGICVEVEGTDNATSGMHCQCPSSHKGPYCEEENDFNNTVLYIVVGIVLGIFVISFVFVAAANVYLKSKKKKNGIFDSSESETTSNRPIQVPFGYTVPYGLSRAQPNMAFDGDFIDEAPYKTERRITGYVN
ncbi:IgGFc-binding protein-like [Pyxicephalus adspersus]|uniref:IgGFc-binding protein-like n=1 Tax=Pyxicephalus adspersus TaxID=30357 RepID=UPI003B5C899A